jgi:2-amino-4-hydroxy-6-hydroxymethyldihydropteridine diphosphokinase
MMRDNITVLMRSRVAEYAECWCEGRRTRVKRDNRPVWAGEDICADSTWAVKQCRVPCEVRKGAKFANTWSNSDVHNTAYLSLGSNIGDREGNLREAITKLEQLGEVKRVSSFYETEPVEFTEQPWFLNCAVELETELTPRELLNELLGIEETMGRKRVQSKGPRLIDLDILLFGDKVIRDKSLAIPHPAMQERRFVLEPLAEIAPDARHPVLKKTVCEMLQELPNGAAVARKISAKPLS